MADDNSSSGSRPRPDPAGSVSSDTFHTSRHYTVLRTTNTNVRTEGTEPRILPNSVLNSTSELHQNGGGHDTSLVPSQSSNARGASDTSLAPSQPAGTNGSLLHATPHHLNITTRRGRDPAGSVSVDYSSGFRARSDPAPSVNHNSAKSAPPIPADIIRQEEELEQRIHEHIGEIRATGSDNVSSVGTFSFSGAQGWQRFAEISTLRLFSLLPTNLRSHLADSFACYASLGLPDNEVQIFIAEEIQRASAPVPDAVPSSPSVPVPEIVPPSSETSSGIPMEYTEIPADTAKEESIPDGNSASTKRNDTKSVASGTTTHSASTAKNDEDTNNSGETEIASTTDKSKDTKSSKYTEVTASSTTPSSSGNERNDTDNIDKLLGAIEKQNKIMLKMHTKSAGVDCIANHDMDMIQKWKTDDFKNPIPKDCTDQNVGNWYDNMKRILGQIPWALNGESDSRDYGGRPINQQS